MRTRRCRLERDAEHLVERHHRVEGQLVADVLRNVVEIGPVPLGDDHVGQACCVRGQDLLLEAPDR
jgi:hypothetical protein